MPDVLREILRHKRGEVARRRGLRPLAEFVAAAGHAPPPRDFAGALRGDEVRIIAEIKRASPSGGELVAEAEFDPAETAITYQENGAAALSVLTDEAFFQGSLEHLEAAREATCIPVLCKDFILGEYQVYEARAAGADAVLLIAAALEPERLGELVALAEELGMAALVETHEEAELEAALDTGATVVGVNNRDLTSFEVDLAVTERLAPMVPEDRVLVAESGVEGREDVERLAQAGADAALVGTSLMTADDPGRALRDLSGVPVVRWRGSRPRKGRA
ncbi:MAG: indole-3-glycerol phosphate synthase TrpC [Armatimonadota bacterium]|nr:indole-3-glycerol phosphate synthase TrpC [Armatimonadota bacterium]